MVFCMYMSLISLKRRIETKEKKKRKRWKKAEKTNLPNAV